MEILNINPTILYLSLVFLTICCGIGEYFHIIPSGATWLFIGSLITHLTALLTGNKGQKQNDSSKQ